MSQGQRVKVLERKAGDQDQDRLLVVDWSEAGSERGPVPAGETVIEWMVDDQLVVLGGGHATPEG